MLEIRDSNEILQNRRIPMPWHYTIMIMTLGKAAVLGASLGLAGLGALDVAFAAEASDWLTEVQRDFAIDAVALGGGAIGIAWKAVSPLFLRG